MPGLAAKSLRDHPLGPLSLAETRRLIWRLPALDASSAEEKERAWAEVGGNPRALESLDALLGEGDFNAALAETVMLTGRRRG